MFSATGAHSSHPPSHDPLISDPVVGDSVVTEVLRLQPNVPPKVIDKVHGDVERALAKPFTETNDPTSQIEAMKRLALEMWN
jgi:hypothetical protein